MLRSPLHFPASGQSICPLFRWRPVVSGVQGKISVGVTKGAVLDRSALPDVLTSSDDYDLLTDATFDQEFLEYQSATHNMKELEKLSAELLENLQDLNSAADALDAMPMPVFKTGENEAKLATTGERRKPSRSAQPASTAGQLLVQQSESAMQDAATPSTSMPQQVLTTGPDIMERQQGQTMYLTAGPSLRAPASVVTTNPALASVLVRSKPSARAHNINSRRASLHSRRAPAGAASVAATGGPRTSASWGSDGTGQFMKKASTVDLLSSISEKQLTEIVQDLLFLERVHKDLKSILRREPSMEEWSRSVGMADPNTLAARLAAGQQAKARMLQANHRLVISVCKKYLHRGVSMQDLITEGVQGLLKGVEKFDASKGFRFSTYAHWWIRQAVTKALSDQGRIVRLPSHMYELLMSIQKARAQLVEELGREPSTQPLASMLKLTPEKINVVMEAARAATSLDVPVGDDDGMASAKDMLEDERSTPDDVLDEMMLRKDLLTSLEDLTEREAHVMRLRFGLDGQDAMTLGDIGGRIHVGRERVRQIEAKALRKLSLKQKERGGILQEYSRSAGDAEVAGRRSQGTNKSR